jgi:hypothetical protein
MCPISNGSGIPGVTPPDVLIFFHIPKTGGTTMEGPFERNFPGKVFYCRGGPTASALLVRTTAEIDAIFQRLTPERQREVRFVIGNHLALDVATLFDRPSKFFTIVRDPVDRAISSFYFFRYEANQPQPATWLPVYRFIKDMTLDQYLDSGMGLDAHNQQVRMLSGCPELDLPWNQDGRPIVVPPVERRHLEMAKRNIEKHFVLAAPLNQFASAVWYLKLLYGMPLYGCLYDKRRENSTRPPLEAVSASTKRRLTEWNQFDLELYDWVGLRFADQLAPMQPAFDRQVTRFTAINDRVQRAKNLMPKRARSVVHPTVTLRHA